MKAILWCFVGFVAGSILLVAGAADPVTEKASDLPLGGFLKAGDRVALIASPSEADVISWIAERRSAAS